MFTAAILLVLAVAAVAGAVALVRWGMCRGARPVERAMQMPGDDWFEGGPSTRVVMTRAVSFAKPPDRVWPWLAQLGRGAGWYSFDLLDNGGRASARRLVSWIPAPCPGDATAVGYLRYLEQGSALVWWMAGEHFLGALARMAFSIRLRSEGEGSRLVIRISGDAAGRSARLSLCLFAVMDSIMACRQLTGIKQRVEQYGPDGPPGDAPETGARDQYQFFHVIYASGEEAGVTGKETAAHWRQAAKDAGVI